jgi:hypothetical protein
LIREVIKPRWFAWLDILGDPIRATTGPVPRTFAGTGDPDLDGFTFVTYHPDIVNISEVRHQEGGAAAVTAQLSGLVLNDNAVLNIIADRTNWQGRSARLWMQIHDQAGVAQGAIVPYHGGFMSSVEINGDPGAQTIDCTIENFAASWSRASGRTYLSQKDFDPGDDSAAAAVAIANGNKNFMGGSGTVGSASGGGGIGGGGLFGPAFDRIQNS